MLYYVRVEIAAPSLSLPLSLSLSLSLLVQDQGGIARLLSENVWSPCFETVVALYLALFIGLFVGLLYSSKRSILSLLIGLKVYFLTYCACLQKLDC